MTYEIKGKTPDGNVFTMPVEAESEGEAIAKAREQLDDGYTVKEAL